MKWHLKLLAPPSYYLTTGNGMHITSG